jgi:hypothetical protein
MGPKGKTAVTQRQCNYRCNAVFLDLSREAENYFPENKLCDGRMGWSN